MTVKKIKKAISWSQISLQLLAIIIFLVSIPLSKAANHCEKTEGTIEVRIIDPLKITGEDTSDLCWSGTYCKPVPVRFKGDDADTQVKDCIVEEKPYGPKQPSECLDDKQDNNDKCDKASGDQILIGKLKLIQKIKATSAANLIKQIVQKIYILGVSLGSIVAVLVIIVSGIQYITAGGDSGKVGNAKERIYQSLAALAVLLLSGLILYTINPTFFVKD